jgi:ketosteroid isomerase-like protein
MSRSAFCQRFIAAVTAGDLDAVAELIDPEFVVTEAEGLPYAGTYRGVDGWRALSKAIVATWGGFRLQLLEVLGETADTLVVRFAIFGRSRKTGTPFASTVLELWRFRGDRLCEIVPYYWDTHHLASIDIANEPGR